MSRTSSCRTGADAFALTKNRWETLLGGKVLGAVRGITGVLASSEENLVERFAQPRRRLEFWTRPRAYHPRSKLAELTDDVHFADVWNREDLAARDRSLITVAVLTAGGDADQLRFHLGRAKENGLSEIERVEAITHLAFYAGWPKP
jgi:alkylhydroperoxidase/carboxymuconolactone decarboxylase family protein YurZ